MTDPPMYNVANAVFCRSLAIVRSLPLPGCGNGHKLNQFINCGQPWPAAYINFNENTHQILVLTKPLCCAQAIFY